MNTLTIMSEHKTETDENLMREVTAGNKRAFDELYQRYNRPLFSFFMKMLAKDREKCEDFLQDLFMVLIEKPHYFDSSRKFKPWIYSVAHNMIKNEYKKMEVRKVMDKNADAEQVRVNGHNPETRTQEKLFGESLDTALSKLDVEKRTAFLMKYRDGFAIQEIAEIQETKEGTIKSRLFYVKKYLSEELAEFKLNA